MIATIIKTKRREKKLSLRRAAEKMNLSHTTLYYLENGEYQPRCDTLAKLANFYDLDLQEILRSYGESKNE